MRSSFIIPLVWFAVATVGVLVAHFIFAVGWAVSLGGAALVIVAVFVNGLIATWEDEQPGGFHNPRQEKKKKDAQHD